LTDLERQKKPRSNVMNILYICPRFPYPADRGDKVVIYNNLKYLSKKNKITLLTFVDDEKVLEEGIANLQPYCNSIETFKKRSNFSIINLVLAIAWKAPFSVIRYYSSQMIKRSKDLIESGKFDIVHIDFYYMAQYVLNKKVKVPEKTAIILTAHNIEYIIYSKSASFTKSPLNKLLIWLESLRIKGYEPSLFKRFDNCVVFSELDKAHIMRLSGATNIKVNPVCVEENNDTQSDVSEERNSILFFGRLNTLPNEDAVRFFHNEVFPLIKKDLPNVKFIIAGRFPTRYILGLTKDPAIKVINVVPDIKELLKKVSLVIVPIRLGGGIRIKILDSWAQGKAVVSTSIGAEGLEYKNKEDMIVADTPPEFKNAVIHLLKSDNLRKAIGDSALKRVREYYNPERIITNLENIYKETLRQKGNRK